MKPVIIIAIAVVCSVIVVYGIVYVPEFIIKSSIESQEQPIVNAFNKETYRCSKIFTTLSAKLQCETNAYNELEIWKLSDNSFQKLNSALTADERSILSQNYEIEKMWDKYGSPNSVEDAVRLLEEFRRENP